MRVYGFGSLRTDPATLPNGSGTTDPEYSLTYRSVTGLEPETTTSVVRERTGFDRLVLWRKGHGLDNHKGGNRMPTSGPMEKCIFTWLRSETDVESCRAASLPLPAAPAIDAGTDAGGSADAGGGG
jgi:hypothetical protein